MKCAKWWMGWLVMGLAAGLAGSASGEEGVGFQFRGGHPWLSRDRVIELPPAGGEESPIGEEFGEEASSTNAVAQRKGKPRAVSPENIHELPGAAGRVFDITIAMYKQRNAVERRKINLVITNFARGVYEMTEGKHFLGKVYVVENPGHLDADIHWESNSGRAYTQPDFWANSEYIVMYDAVIQGSCLNNPEAGGGTLAHEWGHYEYGFKDEYRELNQGLWNNLLLQCPHKEDISVNNSIMAGWIWDRARSFKEQCNLSYDFDEHADKNQMWMDTEETAQHRVFKQSCLRQLRNPVNPRHDALKLGNWTSFKIPQWPEFSDINPTAPPKINLDADGEDEAVQYLNIVWWDARKKMVAICLDRSGSMQGLPLETAKANAKREIDRMEDGTVVEVIAFDSHDAISPVVPFTPLTASNREEIKAQINAIKAGNSTALWDAAGKALADMEALGDTGMKSILLLTDGGDNDSLNESAWSISTKCGKLKVAFNSISYGSNADSQLAEISEKTGGRNLSSSESLASLSSAFSRLGTHGTDRGALVDSEGTVGNTGNWTETFSVDTTATRLQGALTLSVPSTSASIVLESPSGVRYSANSTVNVGNESSWAFRPEQSEAGTWKVIVTAPIGTAVSCFVDSSAVAEPPQLTVLIDETNMVAYAEVRHGASVDGARVRAVVNDNGTKKEVAFTGVGRGAYRLDLSACGTFQNGFTVRVDAEQGIATNTYVGMDYVGDDDGEPISESFTRSEWVALGKENAVTFYSSGKGKLEFQWRTSGDGVPGKIDFLCNGSMNASLASGQGWTKKEIVFDEEGTHVFQWVTPSEVRKFSGTWLKDVIWHPVPDVAMGPIEVTPRWPWNGKVDIDFVFAPTVEGTKATFAVSGVDGDLGTTVKAKTLSGAYRNLDKGTHRVTWDLGADAPGFHSSAFTVRLDATVDPLEAPVLKIGDCSAVSGNLLQWNSVGGAESYSVLRGTNASGTGAVTIATVKSVAGAQQEFWDSTAPCCQTVWYAVKAKAWKLDGERSAWVSARRPMKPPTNVVATAGTRTDGVLVTWTPSAGAVQSRVYRTVRQTHSGLTTGNWNWDFTGSLPIGITNGTSWLDTTATPGKDYVYGVSCVSDEGEESSRINKNMWRLGEDYSPMPIAYGWRNVEAPVVTSTTRTNLATKGSAWFFELGGGPANYSHSGGYSGGSISITVWGATSFFNVKWKSVDGASSYMIKHWPITASTNLTTGSTTSCSFSVAYTNSLHLPSGSTPTYPQDYPSGRVFRIIPLVGNHEGNATEVEIQ